MTEAPLGEQLTGSLGVARRLMGASQDGYVWLKKGIYIAPISDAEMKHLINSRRAVERWSGTEIVTRGLPVDDSLACIIADQEHVAGDAESFIESDRAFHETIVNAAGNPILSGFYEQLRDRQLRMGRTAVSQQNGRSAEVLEEHRRIAQAISAGDADAVHGAIDAHLDSTLRALHWRS